MSGCCVIMPEKVHLGLGAAAPPPLPRLILSLPRDETLSVVMCRWPHDCRKRYIESIFSFRFFFSLSLSLLNRKEQTTQPWKTTCNKPRSTLSCTDGRHSSAFLPAALRFWNACPSTPPALSAPPLFFHNNNLLVVQHVCLYQFLMNAFFFLSVFLDEECTFSFHLLFFLCAASLSLSLDTACLCASLSARVVQAFEDCESAYSSKNPNALSVSNSIFPLHRPWPLFLTMLLSVMFFLSCWTNE